MESAVKDHGTAQYIERALIASVAYHNIIAAGHSIEYEAP